MHVLVVTIDRKLLNNWKQKTIPISFLSKLSSIDLRIVLDSIKNQTNSFVIDVYYELFIEDSRGYLLG